MEGPTRPPVIYPDAKAKADSINPSHYIGENGIECHQAQRSIVGAAGMKAYWTATTLKYLWRWERKNGVEDLRKAQRCIQFLIDLQTEEN